MTKSPMNPETVVLHAGRRADPDTGSNAVFEERMAALDGGAAALAVGSGDLAVSIAIGSLAQAGDNVVCSAGRSGGNRSAFADTLRSMGIEVRFADSPDPENFRNAADERTCAFFAETLADAQLQVFPIGDVAAIADEVGVPLIVDNSAAPIICRPFDHGAHIVVYSSTRYISGHGASDGGVIVDGGRFDWEAHAARYPMLADRAHGDHGAAPAVRRPGPGAYMANARIALTRTAGPDLLPFDTSRLTAGLETLPLRMREHCRNARWVADYLRGHPMVERVIYPTEFTELQRERADMYLTGGFGGLLGFELAGGTGAGERFIDSLELIDHAASLGDTRTNVIHPGLPTHPRPGSEQQLASGVTPGYVCLSVGIEHIDDIIADLEQAISLAAPSARAA